MRAEDMHPEDGGATHDSSGAFTLEADRQTRVVGQFGLEEPALAVLLAVQGALALGAQAIALRLHKRGLRLQVRLAGSLPCRLPSFLDKARQCWEQAGQAQDWRQDGDVWTWSWTRQVSRQRVQREHQLLRQRACYCPVPLKVNGYILQPGDSHYRAPRANSLIKPGYHLAERYTAVADGQPGLAVFRPDGRTRARRLNSEHTYWRHLEPGVAELDWWMPWRVAGHVARLRPCAGFRAGTVAFMLAHPGQPSYAVAIHHGVVVDRFPLLWSELPGLCLLFDASHRPVDISGLHLVHTSDLRDWLEEQRLGLTLWVSQHLSLWDIQGRSHQVNSRQNRKEMGAWLSIWGVTLLTGVAIYLPLPLLSLPWIVWHHASRKRIFGLWRQRLSELGWQP